MKKHIPNCITVVNLLCGVVGIIHLFYHDYKVAAICMVAALIADFADGMIARMLNVASPLGKQLDSLADNVTFGVLPALMWYFLIMQSMSISINNNGITDIYFHLRKYLPYLSLIYAACACWRLAKFNIDERQASYFIGIPTPAAALGTLGLFMAQSYSLNIWIYLLLLLAISIAMVAEIPIMSFKMKDKKPIIGIVILAIILAIPLKWLSLPITILSMVLVSLMLKKSIAS